MNTIIFQTIRAGMVLGIALFAFAGEVFAAPTLTPTEAVQITDTTATLVSHVESINKTSIVWFEWSESSAMSPLTTTGMKSIYSQGFFQGYLSGLNPGTVYYYRAGSSEGGTTVYSSIVSFRTKGGVAPVTATTVSSQNTTATNSSVTKPVATQTKKSTTSTVVAKKTTSTTNTVTTTKDGFTNENANVAAVIGAGDGLLSGALIGCPRTLIGWIVLLVALLLIILLSLMIYESSEKQKKARKAKRIQEAEEMQEIDKILEKNR